MRWSGASVAEPAYENARLGEGAGPRTREARSEVGRAVANASGSHPRGTKTRGRLGVRLFGHLEVALDARRLTFATPRKTLQVLAYLLLHREAPVSREYLAFLLYPDDEEGAARAKLRATLSDLPKILPSLTEQCISIETDKVAWNPDADLWLDVEAFEKASNDRVRLAEAIELYRGDLLPEIYDEWLDVIRERYRNAYLRCLTERVSEARRSADLALAIETARKVFDRSLARGRGAANHRHALRERRPIRSAQRVRRLYKTPTR